MIELIPIYSGDLVYLIKDKLLKNNLNAFLKHYDISVYLDAQLYKSYCGGSVSTDDAELLEEVNVLIGDAKIIMMLHDGCVVRVTAKSTENGPIPEIYGGPAPSDVRDYLFEVDLTRIDDVLGFDFELVYRTHYYTDGRNEFVIDDGVPSFVFDESKYLRFVVREPNQTYQEQAEKLWGKLRGECLANHPIKPTTLLIDEVTFGINLINNVVEESYEDKRSRYVRMYGVCSLNSVRDYCYNHANISLTAFHPIKHHGQQTILKVHEGAYIHLLVSESEVDVPLNRSFSIINDRVDQVIARIVTNFDETGYILKVVARKLNKVWTFEEDIPYFEDSESWFIKPAVSPKDTDEFQNQWGKLFQKQFSSIIESKTRPKS